MSRAGKSKSYRTESRTGLCAFKLTEPTCDACRTGPFQFLSLSLSCGSYRIGEDEKSGGIENLRDGRECGVEFFF